ncbi:MAG: SEC-C metal-binding domain-containing protein [Bryobacteraceae bacterium]
MTIESEVDLFVPFIPPASPSRPFRYMALYDTGATHSSISPKVVADMQLASIGNTNVGVGGGTLTTTSHVVNIGLPNRVMFTMMRVAKIPLHGHIDVIIGMDILGLGDFAVTSNQGRTTFSFCCPSRREIDFVAEIKASEKILPARSDKISRNSPCPCGSGKKYKKCCGRREP